MGIATGGGAGCFLVGSGPSLNFIDIERLINVDTISFNRSYVAWEKWGFTPKFYACLDPNGVEGNAQELLELIKKVSQTHFFLNANAQMLGLDCADNVSLVQLVSGHEFSTDLSVATDFGNVGATAIQLLGLLGYNRIALVGVDARYKHFNADVNDVDENNFIIVHDDPDHFCPEYGRGKRRPLGYKVESVLGRWPMVARECARKSIEVRNSSIGSALECFPFLGFDDALEWVRGYDGNCV